MKVQSDNMLNTDALLDPNRLDQSRVDIGQPGRGLAAADGLATQAPTAERSATTEARDPGEDVLQAKVWDDASPRSLAHFASGLDVAAIAPDALALDRAADAILAGLVD